MTDIVERLRKICEPITVTGDPDTVSACQDLHELISADVREAADEIKRLRAALREIEQVRRTTLAGTTRQQNDPAWGIARAALGEAKS